MKKLIQKIKMNGSRSRQAGMTYVELIVVLSIFAVMSSIVVFNYGSFQAKVDIKNLASDISFKIVEAQKSSINGLQPTLTPTVSPWKPAYGVYFNLTSPSSFIFFVDLDNSNFFSGTNCNGECLNYITTTKGNFISRIDSYLGVTPTPIAVPLAITFKRPDSRAIFSTGDGTSLTGFDYMQITIKSPRGPATGLIKIFPSGRVEVK